MSEKKLIYEKISEVMSNVGAVGKDRKADKFQFRGIDDMYNALNQHLANAKVFFTSEVLDMKREERATKSGGAVTYSILTMRFTAYAEDGSSVSSITVGEAMDSGDKSMNKAMSVAYKYALMQIFCIPTEDEKDTEYHTYETASEDYKKMEKEREEIAGLLYDEIANASNMKELKEAFEHVKNSSKEIGQDRLNNLSSFVKTRRNDLTGEKQGPTLGARDYEDSTSID